MSNKTVQRVKILQTLLALGVGLMPVVVRAAVPCDVPLPPYTPIVAASQPSNAGSQGCNVNPEDRVVAQQSNIVEQSNLQRANITTRIYSFFRKFNTMEHQKLSALTWDDVDPNSVNKAAAGDDEDVLMDDFGVYLNGNAGFGNRKSTHNAMGYDLDRQDTTLGADYKLTDHLLLGVAFGYSHVNNSFVNGLGNIASESYIGSAYGSFFTDEGYFVEGIFSGSAIDYNSHNTYLHNQAPRTQAWASSKGTELDISMTTGYNWSKDALTLTPQVRVEYITADIGAQDQKGAQGQLVVHTADQFVESLKTGLGGQASYAMSFSWGVLVPTARIEWLHEFQNDSHAVLSRFTNGPLRIQLTDKPDRNYMSLGAGVSTQFAHGISSFVNYETLQGQNYLNNHVFTGGLRLEF